MKRARTLEDFRRRKPAAPLYRYTRREMLQLCAWVLLVEGLVLGLAWMSDWSWFWEYGRLALIPPTAATALAWHAYCARRSSRGSAADMPTDQRSK
jgi:hypothetical protein